MIAFALARTISKMMAYALAYLSLFFAVESGINLHKNRLFGLLQYKI